MDYIHHYDSPLGGITIASNGNVLTGLWFDDQKYFGENLDPCHTVKPLPIFGQVDQWLDIYFNNKIPNFTPPLLMRTTPFRQEVWKILLSIPYGQTMTYGEIANRIAKDHNIQRMSAQAIGNAVGHNSISLIIPCHRVVGSNGSLTGYAGGIDKKRKLFALEGICVNK